MEYHVRIKMNIFYTVGVICGLAWCLQERISYKTVFRGSNEVMFASVLSPEIA